MEQEINNIVIGFDFSAQATEALKTALEIGAKSDAVVHIMTALPGHLDRDVLKAATSGATARRDQLFSKEALMENLEARLSDIVQKLDPEKKTKVTCEVSAEKPFQALTGLCELHHADLLMVGDTGMDAMERFLVGSTSQKLVRKSRWPVMVAKNDKPWPPRNILCPVDFSSASRRALGWAGELAGLYGAHVHVLHVHEVVPTAYMEVYGIHPEPTHEQILVQQTHIMEKMEAFCDISDMKGVAWTPHIESGRISHCIEDVVKKTDADLMCMGSVGRTGLGNMLIGNTAERVMRGLPCSLLTVKPDDFVLNH